MNRQTTVVVSVIALHMGALWALQNNLLQRVPDARVPADIVVEIMAPPAPPAPTTPQPVAQAQPKVQPKAPTPKPVQPAPTAQAAPSPLAIAPSANTPEPSAAAPTATAAAPASTPNAPSATPAPPKVTQPSTDANYLNNARPQYPPMSKRLNEQGKVVVRALIGVNGAALQASIKSSSGFDRLDQAALATVLKWHYVPGKRGGVAEAMWFDIPVNWVLQ